VHPLADARVLPAAALAIAALALAACGGGAKHGGGGKRVGVAPPPGDVQQGMGTWYGVGRGTASGEPFDKRAMTAAHPSFPFNTRVRVTNLRNGRAVILRINDRGPFARGRIIDVTEAAAEQLGMKEAGVVPVKVERLR
jgi:peptidoglycan lytic transglycosylase